MINKQKLQLLAKDLTKEYPRSPRKLLGGYVILARCVDKCRAALMGINGEYNYWPCSLGSQMFAFTGVTPEEFKQFVSTGAADEEVADWLNTNSQIKNRLEVIRWNNRMRDMRLSEISDEGQEYVEQYIEAHVPKHRPVYVWFDMFDLEEERI